MNVKSFIKNIRATSSVEDVLANLNEIKVLAENPQVLQNENNDIAAKLDNTIQTVLGLKKNLRRLDQVLALYQQQADSTIKDLKQLIDITITDYSSAYNATESYDKNWFANSMFSEDAKLDLASYLLTTITSYCQDNTETLEMIINRNDELLQYISYPRIKD